MSLKTTQSLLGESISKEPPTTMRIGKNGISGTKKFYILPGNAQHIGARAEQQDSFGLSDLQDEELLEKDGALAVLADGMGGLAMGREAGDIAVQTFLARYIDAVDLESIPDRLAYAVREANNNVVEMAKESDIEGYTGSTLVAAVILRDTLYWVSVGDSRIYLYRSGRITKLSTDHIYARELDEKVLNGAMTKEEADNHPERLLLTSYLGQRQIESIDRNTEPFCLKAGDRVVLCSDGLYGSVTEKEMEEILYREPFEAAELLVEKALSKGKANQDNITVVIFGCEKEQTPFFSIY